MGNCAVTLHGSESRGARAPRFFATLHRKEEISFRKIEQKNHIELIGGSEGGLTLLPVAECRQAQHNQRFFVSFFQKIRPSLPTLIGRHTRGQSATIY